MTTAWDLMEGRLDRPSHQPEGLSVHVCTPDRATAIAVAPLLARRLYPWLDRSTLDVLHVEPDGETTEVVLKVNRGGPR